MKAFPAHVAVYHYHKRFVPGGGVYLTKEVTRVCGKSLHTLYPVT